MAHEEGRLRKAELGAGWTGREEPGEEPHGAWGADGVRLLLGVLQVRRGPPKTPEALWGQSRGSQQPWLCPQACRGGALDQGVSLETDSGQPEPCSFSEYLRIPPNTAVMFACSPGKETPREPKAGGNAAGSNASPLPLQATEPS